MAYVNTHRRSGGALMGRVTASFDIVRERYARYRTYRRTLNELSDLSDRELNDLGLNRSMIRACAYEAAYGK